ncbi:putative transcription factor C2H2 family [Helianthus annuus]|nr:putative transcription factor C2H2 family [Helianthus annuus]
MATVAPGSATVDPDRSPPLCLDSIPAVDLRLLSQSELHSLSQCSNSSSDLHRCDDVVIPKIDRSVFNESAGSRKQTYSRLRLAPPDSSAATTIHRRMPRIRASRTLASNVVNDPEQAENSQIVGVLKELFSSDSSFQDLPPVEVDKENESNAVAPESLNTKAAESLDTEASELLETKAPELLHTKAPELLDTEAPESLETEAPELLETKAPELLHTEAPELFDTEAPELFDTEAPELFDTEAPESLETEAPELLETKAPELLHTEAPELLDIEAPKVLETVAPELLETEASASLGAPESLETEAPESFGAPELLETVAAESLAAPQSLGAPELLEIGPFEFIDSDTEAPKFFKPQMPRKRGRPRKDENAVSIRPPAAKRMRDSNSTVKKVVVYDDDKDREIVNSRGEKVNLMNLGRLEDPYGPEIRRRTEGLSTSDELLGFLRGLNGQWGTTRKKRRVVDASDFGDALPKGWKLSLCIKKKEGHLWIFCRRYISPSGRQFESCKDISMYLLSILGEENMDEPNHPHINNHDDSALKESSGNAANLYAQEDLERNSTVHNSSTPPISLPADCEKQIEYGIVGPVNAHVDVYKCLKCYLIFEGKNELWDHKSLSHKDEQSQLGSSIPDWSIVIGGIFNCNLCHKTFYEINQYNGHIGTHATNENKTAEKSVDSVSVSAETDHDHRMSFVTESNKIDEVAHDLDMNEDVLIEESGDGIGNKCVNDNNALETDKAPVVSVSVSVSKPECDLDQDIVVRSNDQDSGSETRVQSSSICEEKGFQPDINDTRIYSSFDELTTEKGNVVYNESSGVFHGVSNGQDAVSETRVHTSSICEEKGYREKINDVHMSSSFDEFTSEKGKVLNNESSSGVFHGISYGQDAVSEARVQTKGFRENINDTHIFSPFGVLTSEKGKVVNKDSSSGVFHGISNGQDAVSETRVHTSSICEEKGYREKINDMHMSSSFDEFTSEKGKVVNNESSSGVFHGITYGQDAVSEAKVQTKGFRENINDTHIFTPFGVLTSEKGKVVNKDSSSGVFHNHLGRDQARLAETKKLSESENLSLFSNTLNIAVDNSKKQDSFQKLGFASVDQVAHGFDENRFSYNMSSSKLDEPYGVRNREFDRYVGKGHVNKEYVQIKNAEKSGEANLNEYQVFRNNDSINNEVVSLGSSSQNGLNANVMNFNTGKNIEFSSLVPPGNNQAFGFQDGLKFDDIFGDKFDENIHELSLAFGNPNSLYEDTVGVSEQKKDGLNCSSRVSSKINDTFDVQTDLSMVNNSMVQDLKRGNETRGFQNNDNSVYPGRTWGDFKSDEFRNSEGKKFMMGSGSNQMWKTPQGNHLQSGLVNSNAPIQSPNFHSFDIMSQKAQDGLFRQHTERYNQSRSEPVEFRFLTDRSEHNPHALQSGSRVFPYNYNTGIDQGFDSSFWMGKNAMMPPHMSGRNVITSICAWCRNEFHLPAMAIHQQTQAGVGSLCPNCSAGISGQVNML